MDAPPRARETYWLTRFVLLRLLGLIYAIAFLAAVQQLVPLIGSDGITPARLFLPMVAAHFGSTFDAFWQLPSLFWFDYSDTALRVIPWIGLILSCAVAAGFANSIMMAVLWVLYLSIVHVGQDWYGFGWEIQLCETGFLAIFLVPLLDVRQHSIEDVGKLSQLVARNLHRPRGIVLFARDDPGGAPQMGDGIENRSLQPRSQRKRNQPGAQKDCCQNAGESPQPRIDLFEVRLQIHGTQRRAIKNNALE